MPTSDTSYSIVKGMVKLGRANTGVEANACLRAEKTRSAVRDHLKLSFFKSSVKG